MPLDPKLTKFTTASPILASYSYTDIADGTGIITLNGSNVEDSAAVDFILSTNTYYTEDVLTQANQGNPADFTKVLDINFDLSAFNSVRTIKGTAHFTISESLLYAGQNCDSYLILKVRKYDGSTETDVASVQTQRLDTDGAGTYYKTHICELEIPETIYAVGDVLRITVEAWVKGGSGTIDVHHDPQGATVGTLKTTQFISDIPFKIDL